MIDGQAVPPPAAAIEAAAAVLHDEDCDTDGGTTDTCGRWQAGIDPESRFHQHHVGHVEFYRDRARRALAAAAPVIAAAERERIRQRAA